MDKVLRTRLALVSVLLAATWITSGRLKAQEDVADIRSEDLRAQQDASKHYLLIGPRKEAEAPEDGYGLVVVLPGGGGGENFHPFVKRIFKHALPPGYLAAQLVAVKWTPEQKVVWPTRKSPAPEQKFSTEDFVEAVVKDVNERHKLNDGRIFTLAWSSGGPAAYAVSLQKETRVTGSFIAMSVFKPSQLGSLKAAKGHAYFLYHSPDDKVCPFRMAKAAQLLLQQNGARTELASYEGGHGWHRNVYADIRRGIEWLEHAPEPAPEVPEEGQAAPPGALPLSDGFETGNQAPDGWTQGAQIPGVEYIWDKNVAFEGNASLCLEKTAQRFWPIAQWSCIMPHQTASRKLEIKAQVKARQVTKAVIDIQFLDAQGQWIKHEWAAYIGARESGDPPANHDWREYAGTVSIPSGTKRIRFALQIYGPGKVWFDELNARYAE